MYYFIVFYLNCLNHLNLYICDLYPSLTLKVRSSDHIIYFLLFVLLYLVSTIVTMNNKYLKNTLHLNTLNADCVEDKL